MNIFVSPEQFKAIAKLASETYTPCEPDRLERKWLSGVQAILGFMPPLCESHSVIVDYTL